MKIIKQLYLENIFTEKMSMKEEEIRNSTKPIMCMLRMKIATIEAGSDLYR